MINNDINFKNLEKLIPQVLKADLYKDKKFKCCPHCNSTHFIKHGKYKGIQRYMCRECKRTFSSTTNSLWYYSKKDPTIWLKYIELFLQRKTLKECSQELTLNIATSFYWRHKILNILKSAHIYGVNPEKFVGNASANTVYFQEKTPNSVINFKLDPYQQQNYIIAVAARDSKDSMLIKPLSRFRLNLIQFNKKIVGKLEPKTSIILNGKERFYKEISKEDNNIIIKRKQIKSKVIDEKIKFIKITLSGWFSGFHGIATKYLEKYLPYFLLYNLDYCFKSIDMSYSLVKYFGFIKTSDIKDSELIL
ncbi:IS1 family transposase [Clostridium sp. SM-530-WT-3G]|uniref:IS1 family transposase n=1 Tax=Clostridium sp. SM-530-WT-3G TaxID=2725303 RepID=UPI00145C4AD9|nr:IS1 family transposase [Clostridium sp. SM-530-WT-3G]NME83314.1 IS1 family transposase [Clostridium sp. SM-530-WT-3G]